MGNVKAIALDMDGTLLNNAGDISEGNREAIAAAAERGIDVILSTGRFIQSVREYATGLHLSAYFVTTNGSEIWYGDELIERHVMAPDHVRWLQELAVHEGVWYWGMASDQLFPAELFPEAMDRHQWLKFGFDVMDGEARARMRAALETFGQFEVTNSTPTNLELNPKGVNKAMGLGEICRLRGYQMSQVLAVGDSLNDVAMIRAAGYGVAMENAQPTVKEAADWITTTNERDGVAFAIRKWALV